MAMALAVEASIFHRHQATAGFEGESDQGAVALSEGYLNFSKALLGALSREGGAALRNRILGGEMAPAELAELDVEDLAPAALHSKRLALRRAAASAVNPMDAAVPMTLVCPACQATAVRGLESGSARDIRKSEIWGGASKADGGTVRCVCDGCGHGWVVDA
jgi:hypothetical protein